MKTVVQEGDAERSAAGVLDAAIEMACEVGLAGVGPRPLFVKKSLPRSAVNYHFGTRSALIEAVYIEILRRRRRKLKEAIDRFAEGPRRLLSMSGLFVAVHGAEQLWSRGEETFLLEVKCRSDVFSDALRVACCEDIREREGLWARAGELFGCEEKAHVWFLASLGLPDYAILFEDPEIYIALLANLTERLADRLDGRPVRSGRGAGEADDEFRLSDGAYSGASLAIANGAAALLLSGQGLTYRAVASESGVALSTVKFMFPRIEEIILAAYRVFHRRLVAHPNLESSIAASLNMGQLYDASGKPADVASAFQALAAFTVRKPDLRVLAREMRQLRGQMSERQLVANKVPGANRVDGVLWSIVTTGAFYAAMGQPEQKRLAWLKAEDALVAKSLFGEVGRSSEQG